MVKAFGLPTIVGEAHADELTNINEKRQQAHRTRKYNILNGATTTNLLSIDDKASVCLWAMNPTELDQKKKRKRNPTELDETIDFLSGHPIQVLSRAASFSLIRVRRRTK